MFKHADFTQNPNTGALSLTRNEVNVQIERDVYAESPDQWGNEDIFLVAFHDRHFSVHREGYHSFEGALATAKEEGKLLVPVFAHIHSGIMLYLRANNPCPWDSGFVGYVVVDPNEVPNPDAAAEALVETWNTYCSGDVYVVSADHPRALYEEIVGGVYGLDAALETAHEFYEKLAQPIQPMLKTCPSQVYWTC